MDKLSKCALANDVVVAGIRRTDEAGVRCTNAVRDDSKPFWLKSAFEHKVNALGYHFLSRYDRRMNIIYARTYVTIVTILRQGT
jgi:hypothetical protein